MSDTILLIVLAVCAIGSLVSPFLNIANCLIGLFFSKHLFGKALIVIISIFALGSLFAFHQALSWFPTATVQKKIQVIVWLTPTLSSAGAIWLALKPKISPAESMKSIPGMFITALACLSVFFEVVFSIV